VRKLSIYQDVDIDLDAILKLSEDIDWQKASVGNYSSLEVEVDQTFRDASLRKLKTLQETIFPQIHSYVEDCSGEPLKMESFTLVRYTKGQFFSEHSDGGEGFSRKLSIVIYLNDDYEGGEIYFRNLNLTMKPRTNSLVIFPSTEEFVHEAKPVLSGTKYVITSFWR
jgi:Rps23 Pro-64 3,4-dihydroxylase Tpa1-like proline 4-hydroxylase